MPLAVKLSSRSVQPGFNVMLVSPTYCAIWLPLTKMLRPARGIFTSVLVGLYIPKFGTSFKPWNVFTLKPLNL